MSEDQRPPDGEEPTRLDSGDLRGESDDATRQGRGEPDDSAPRKRLGDFNLLRELGRGGMGVVYEARQISLNRRVALKVLPPGLGLTETAVQRFEREARAAAKLHHTNIVPVHAIGEEENCHYYAMELVEGQPLSEVLRDLTGEGSNPLLDATVTKLGEGEKPESEPEPTTSQEAASITSLSDSQSGSRKWFDAVAKLISEVADALDYAHGRGVIHRDIKPANLMLSREGKLCITDFGLARVAQEPGMTVSGSLLGTPAYMSPEQIAVGRVKLDHRTDIYSLGAVLYELLALRRPFPGDSREEILSGILTKDPRPPRRFNPRIPLDLETICQKAMEKDPDRRYQNAGEFANDLRQYLQGGLIAARRAGLPRRTWKSIRRHPMAATVAIGVVLFGLLVGFGWRTLRQANAPRLIAEASLALERGDYRAGLDAAERALELQPGLPEARIVRARLLLQLLRYDEVISEARTILDDNPDDWAAHFILAYVSKGGERPTIPAAEHLAAVEQLAPESADVHFLHGLLAKSASEAVEHHTRALDLDPAHTWALVERSHKYGDLKDFDAAKADAERLLAIRPHAADGRQNLGCVYRRQLDYEKSLAEFAKAIELDPDDPETYWERGALYRDMHRYKDALADYTRAIEIGPARSEFYSIRAWTYFPLGRNEEAIADARRALELNPDNRAALDSLLTIYQNLDRPEDFQRTADELRARAAGWVDPEARAYVNRKLAAYYYRAGDSERALVEAGRAVEADPGNLQARIGRIQVLWALNDEARFEAECDALAALDLVDPEPRQQRAFEIGFTCLRWEPYLELTDSLIEDRPTWHRSHTDRGLANFFLGRLEEAIADFTRAIELNPRDWAGYNNRGAVYDRLHRYEEGLADMEKAVELNPTALLPRSNLGIKKMQLGRVREALADYDKAIELDPFFAQAHASRAEALAFLGDCDGAMEAFERALELNPDPNTLGNLAAVHTGSLFHICPDRYDPAAALDLASRALAATPVDPGALGVYGGALYRNGRFREALENIEKSLAPSEIKHSFLSAMCLWQLGRRAEARAHYEKSAAFMEEHRLAHPMNVRLREEAAALLGIED
jgi:serine/threonine protein kinase/Flp pilus assembly protein TadD